MKDIHNAQVENLFHAIMSLESTEDCYRFFGDLCTVNEILEFSQRFAVAYMLDSGNNYNDIAAKTGMSTATISRVSKCLYGERGGYRRALDRICEKSADEADEADEADKTETEYES